MPQLDAISFLFVLFIVSTILLAVVLRYGFTKKLQIADGLRFGLFWAVFVTVVLVMNQIGRETLDPGRWPRERLFEPVVHSEVGGMDSPVVNLLFGWILFPLRTFPLATVAWDGILTGLAVLLICAIFLELLGRTLSKHWQSRWTPSILFGFLLLDLMTYSTIGFVRQVGWIILG